MQILIVRKISSFRQSNAWSLRMLLVSQNGKKSWGLKYYNSHNLLGKKSPILDRNAKTLILPVLINVNLENNPSPNT